jgi:CcmD family protein
MACDDRRAELVSRRAVRVKQLLVPAAWAGLAVLRDQPAMAQDAADERAQSFQAVKGAVKEDVPGGPLLLAAYGVVWVIVLLYVFRLARQQQRSQADLARLERVLTQSEGTK